MDTGLHNHDGKHPRALRSGPYHVLCSYFLSDSPQVGEMSTVITILNLQMRKPSYERKTNNVFALATSDCCGSNPGFASRIHSAHLHHLGLPLCLILLDTLYKVAHSILIRILC